MAEVSLKNDAPGAYEEVLEFIEEHTKDKVGFSVNLGIGSVDVFANRKIRLDDVTLSTDGIATAAGAITYATGPNAAVSASLTLDLNIKYDIPNNEIQRAEVTKSNNFFSVTIDLKDVKEVLEGNYSAALDLIPNGGLVKREITSEYDSRKKFFQDKYGAENIYFASSDFVRWASPVTAGKFIVLLIASGGSAAPAIAQEVRAQIRKELVHILTWMKTRLAANVDSIVNDLVNGQPIAIPQLKLVWQKVVYRSKVQVVGRSLAETPPIDHAAFVLIWDANGTFNIDFDRAPNRTAVDDSTLRPRWTTGLRFQIGPTGDLITFVRPGQAGEKAGLKVGDVILKAAGKPVGVTDNSTDLLQQIVKLNDSQQIDLEVLSQGVTKTVTVTLDPVL